MRYGNVQSATYTKMLGLYWTSREIERSLETTGSQRRRGGVLSVGQKKNVVSFLANVPFSLGSLCREGRKLERSPRERTL